MSMLQLSETPTFSLQTPRLSSRRPTPSPSGAARQVSSTSLLEGGRELVIHHGDSQYHLRLTRNDKLILTK